LINLGSIILFSESIADQLGGKLFHMLTHTISGKVDKSNVSGIHFFDPDFHKVIEVTKEKNEKGIWEARIEALRPTKNDWIKKDRPSTFFPTGWTKDLLVVKLHQAFLNKKKLSRTEFQGETDCGIKIVFRIEGDELVSVYPKYE
jgi:hypothetical protein